MLNRFLKCQVPLSATILDAMRALDEGAAEIALVVESDGRLAGTLTDGDVRRALLGGASFSAPLAPYVLRHFTAVDPSAGRAEVVELMQARRIGQIPVVDGEGRLVGLHLLHEMIGGPVRSNWAVIMAGGKGTRLGSITQSLPKPMVRVAGRPIVERLILHLMGHGIRRVFLSINHLGHIVEEHFGDGRRFGCRIDYLRETQPLGTAGSLSLLPEPPSEPVVVMNGDLVTQADIGAMIQYHTYGRYKATMAVKEYAHTVPYGCVEVEDGQITDLEEKPCLTRKVNAGIYVLDPELLARVPREEYLMTTLLEEVLALGEPLGAFEILDDWIDVGQPEQLRTARQGAG